MLEGGELRGPGRDVGAGVVNFYARGRVVGCRQGFCAVEGQVRDEDVVVEGEEALG